MDYKVYKSPSFNIYTIKTDRFKSSHMEIIFRSKAIKNKMTSYAFLADILTESTKEYPSRRYLMTRMEELYELSIYGTTTRVGNILNTSIILDFINPEYINEEDYLENSIKLPFEILNNPNVINKEFDLKTFNIVKERIRKDIESIKENPFKQSIRETINYTGFDTATSYPLLGTIEDLEAITPSSLYNTYEELFKENVCDIFIIGNLDMDEVASIIKREFKNRYISKLDTNMYITNKENKRPLVGSIESNNIQASLVMIYNVNELNDFEKNAVIHVFNYIFGNGGLTSKLYQNLREKNSLCYGVTSMVLKYDSLLLIQVSLDNESVSKAISLIKKSLKEMTTGNFTIDTLNDAINNLIISMDYSMDNCVPILSNYVFNIFDNLPMPEERKKLYKKVTKEDIINVAKKLKLNTVFTLKGGNK